MCKTALVENTKAVIDNCLYHMLSIADYRPTLRVVLLTSGIWTRNSSLRRRLSAFCEPLTCLHDVVHSFLITLLACNTSYSYTLPVAQIPRTSLLSPSSSLASIMLARSSA